MSLTDEGTPVVKYGVHEIGVIYMGANYVSFTHECEKRALLQLGPWSVRAISRLCRRTRVSGAGPEFFLFL
jgi:hypothetical protein